MTSEVLSPDREKFVNRVRESLQNAEKYAARYRTTNTRLIVLATILSAAATVITGATAANGPLLLEGIPGWRLACTAGAILGFITTVSVGISQQLNLSDKALNGNQCASRLRFLDLALDTRARDWEDLVKEYEDIIRAYPEPIRG